MQIRFKPLYKSSARLFIRIFIFAWLLLSVSCALTSKKPAPPAAASFKVAFARIQRDVREHAYKRAIYRLNYLLRRAPPSQGTDDAFILLGQLYFREGNYTESYRAFVSVLNWQYASPRETDAKIGAARALFRLSRYDEALNFTKMLTKQGDAPKPILVEANYLQYNIQWQLGDHLDALRSLVFLAQNAPEAAERERYKIRAADVADSALNENEIATVAGDPSFGFVRLPALYHVGVSDFENKNYDQAESSFDEILSLAPNSDIAQDSKRYVKQIDARRRVDPYTIGVILPMGAKDTMISDGARRTLRGLELGLGIYDKNPSNFKLAVKDSEGNPDIARRDAEDVVVNDNAIAIVGDILSKDAEAVAQKADELGVPNIGLSQKPHLTQVGDSIFQNALTGQALVKELVQTAMDKYGMKRFAILYPNDGYGVDYANLFWDEVLAHGGQIAGAQVYARDETDFHGSVERLLGTFYLEARSDEYVNRLKEWYKEQRRITSHIVVPDDIIPPVTDFDAIFIPDDVKSLGQITSRLVASDVQNVWLLGTNLWNTSDLITRGTQLADRTLFVDAQGVVDNSFQNTPFYAKYQKIFGEPPTIFEAQAYDTGRILRQTIENGARTRPALHDALLNVRQFPGIVGDIDVDSDREFTRPLTVLTVQNGKILPAGPTLPAFSNPSTSN